MKAYFFSMLSPQDDLYLRLTVGDEVFVTSGPARRPDNREMIYYGWSAASSVAMGCMDELVEANQAEIGRWIKRVTGKNLIVRKDPKL